MDYRCGWDYIKYTLVYFYRIQVTSDAISVRALYMVLARSHECFVFAKYLFRMRGALMGWGPVLNHVKWNICNRRNFWKKLYRYKNFPKLKKIHIDITTSLQTSRADSDGGIFLNKHYLRHVGETCSNKIFSVFQM